MTEPEWDELQSGWILALAAYRASLCPGCGGDLEETTAEANVDRYIPLIPLQCNRCIGLHRASQPYVTPLSSGHKSHEAPHALLHRVELRPARG